MSGPTGSDASTDSDESTRESTRSDEPGHPPDATDSALSGAGPTPSDAPDSLLDTASDWARHWKAWGIAALSLVVVGWSIRRPELSPKGYIPIFLGFAALAVGYVYLDEESQVKLASG